MIVHHGWKDVPSTIKKGSVAIGNFDGVHRGHQVLLGETQKVARLKNTPAGVIIFEPHPREFFHPEEKHFRLTSVDAKLSLFETIGLDFVAVLPFDKNLAGLEHFQFIDCVLVEGYNVSNVIVGYDFFYGRNRRGSPETMILAGIEHDFEVNVIPPVAEGGEVFSSTAIRLKLAQGDVVGAALELGRNWRIKGKVISGAKRGKDLGYPTANFALPKGTTLGHGIYAVRTYFQNKSYPSVAYLGTRPSFDNGQPLLEVFILDFDSDIYGHEMEVEFIKFLRADRKFDSSEALIEQMHKDVLRAKEVFSQAHA